ncbi:MAG: RluA family pseudouridine synthase [Pseudomonadota bacterium]
MSSEPSLPVLHEDAELLVIDKPPGHAVHPGPKTPHSLEDRLDELRFGYRRLPQPAHRLDRDTSGCLVLARNPRALKRMNALFADGAVEKHYVALLAGRVEGEGTIDAPLAKISSAARGWRMRVDPGGRAARTAWRAGTYIEALAATPVAFRPATGRTHQIRIHAAHALAPICGDPVYGADGNEDGGSMRLHAVRIAFDWRGDRRVDVVAPLPPGWPDLPDGLVT